MSNTPAQHFAYITAERAAEIISGGTAMFTPDQLAGWYAFDAARDNGAGFEDCNLIGHLEFIRSLGAEFDKSSAISAAREYAAKWAAEQ